MRRGSRCGDTWWHWRQLPTGGAWDNRRRRPAQRVVSTPQLRPATTCTAEHATQRHNRLRHTLTCLGSSFNGSYVQWPEAAEGGARCERRLQHCVVGQEERQQAVHVFCQDQRRQPILNARAAGLIALAGSGRRGHDQPRPHAVTPSTRMALARHAHVTILLPFFFSSCVLSWSVARAQVIYVIVRSSAVGMQPPPLQFSLAPFQLNAFHHSLTDRNRKVCPCHRISGYHTRPETPDGGSS